MCVVVLSGRELDEGRRATMWVSPHVPWGTPEITSECVD